MSARNSCSAQLMQPGSSGMGTYTLAYANSLLPEALLVGEEGSGYPDEEGRGR